MRAVRRLASLLAASAIALYFVACSGTSQSLALDEPLRVPLATFKEGALPGTPPATTELAPTITSLESQSTIIRSRQSGKNVVGRASTDAVAVALAFGDLGTGYWVLPVDGPDPQSNGEFTWAAKCDFGSNLPPGNHPLRFVAIDANGHAGTQRDLSTCVSSETPDNGNACIPTSPLPASVFSLEWDEDVDLDLSVVLPNGRVVSGKSPRTSIETDAGVPLGTVDRDSNASCVIDGFAREDLTFLEKPSAGSYLVYANLFDACGKTTVHFRFSLYERQANADGTPKLVKTIAKSGQLAAVDANGGARTGTFLTEIPY